MDKWLDLLTPSAAALSLLLAIALIVQAIRHGRAVRRLENRLAEREGAAARVSLDRLAQLQRRTGTSTRPTSAQSAGPRLPRLGTAAAVLGVLALLAGTSWYLFLRDGESVSAQNTTTGSVATTSTTAPKPTPVEQTKTTVPENPAPLSQSKGAYTILVLNATTIAGAAGQGVVPIVQRAGYITAPPDNAPTRDAKISFVMYLPNKEAVADNVAKDLGITRRLPLDGYAIDQSTSDIDAVVVVGEDLANKFRP